MSQIFVKSQECLLPQSRSLLSLDLSLPLASHGTPCRAQGECTGHPTHWQSPQSYFGSLCRCHQPYSIKLEYSVGRMLWYSVAQPNINHCYGIKPKNNRVMLLVVDSDLIGHLPGNLEAPLIVVADEKWMRWWWKKTEKPFCVFKCRYHGLETKEKSLMLFFFYLLNTQCFVYSSENLWNNPWSQ